MEKKTKYIYLASIMGYGKTSPRKLRFDEALVVFECLIQFLSKCFVCRLRKHTVSHREANKSNQIKEFKQRLILNSIIYILL